MNVGTILAIVLVAVILIALALWNRRNERREAELKRGRPKGSEVDPPWKDH